jgi:transcriptional regulator with XRE-family HTH domain
VLELDIPAGRRIRPLDRALAQARAAGIPQRCVAEEAGISVSLLSQIVHGHAPVTPSTAAALARALGREPADLFPGLINERAA